MRRPGFFRSFALRRRTACRAAAADGNTSAVSRLYDLNSLNY